MEKLQFARELRDEYRLTCTSIKIIISNPKIHDQARCLYALWCEISAILIKKKSYPPLIDTGGWTGEDWGFYEGGEL